MPLVLPLISFIAFMIAQTQFAQQAGIGSLPLAILMGIVVSNCLPDVTVAKRTQYWMDFSRKQLLRMGIILFGSHLTLEQLSTVGWQAALLDSIVIITVLCIGYFLGVRVLGMNREETILTSVGSAVCGAAAIMATEPVLKAKQQHVSVAVATVVVFGTLALFCYPIIYRFTDISSASFGVYIGSTVHEVAQAVAAGQAINTEAMNNAVIVKLMRVMMLAPVVMVIAWLYQRHSSHQQSTNAAKIPIPWFVLGFIFIVVLNSVAQWPPALQNFLQTSAQILLTVAMTALGLQTKLSAVRAAGVKPLILSAILFGLLLGGGLIAHQWLY